MTLFSRQPLRLNIYDLNFLLEVIAYKINIPVERVIVTESDCSDIQAARILSRKLASGKGITVMYVPELYDIKKINRMSALAKKKYNIKSLMVVSPVSYSRWMLDK